MSDKEMSQELVLGISRKIDKLCLTIEQVKDRQDEMHTWGITQL